MRIQLQQGDITRQTTDAIVNAANNTLLGGGGVDGAIHQVAGPGLLSECKKLNGCPTGMAKITHGHNLSARYVIHTVGPVWKGGNNKEQELLKACYSNSLKLAEDYNLNSIAFPNISTGIYHFPKDLAAEIAIKTVKTTQLNYLRKIVFVCFDNENYLLYTKLIN